MVVGRGENVSGQQLNIVDNQLGQAQNDVPEQSTLFFGLIASRKTFYRIGLAITSFILMILIVMIGVTNCEGKHKETKSGIIAR